ncbi:MAG TPA: TIGR01777 family oxidoreductase, partial [Candidatus Limnocylindrales bacterium]|nr:TIGR01777 family oxidoreductase [Candidatus Limnocylindrales bacterium]
MRIVIAGGSGFLGRRLTAAWIEAGEQVTVLSRSPHSKNDAMPSGADVRSWSPPTVDEDLISTLRGADAVVNLAGVSIGGRPWTPGRKRVILGSRLAATNAIVDAIGRLSPAERPKVLVNASGVDVYGDRPSGELTEGSEPGNSFLAGVVVAWEAAARRAESFGVRVVLARTALIVAPEALAWRLVLLPFRLFIGGPLGTGRQRFTWVHVDDAVGLYDLAVRDLSIAGPLNIVAPEVPTQRELARAIGRRLRRPSLVPVPAFVLRLALWGQADMLLHGRVARSAKALARGYRFRHPTVESALSDVLA